MKFAQQCGLENGSNAQRFGGGLIRALPARNSWVALSPNEISCLRALLTIRKVATMLGIELMVHADIELVEIVRAGAVPSIAGSVQTIAGTKIIR